MAHIEIPVGEDHHMTLVHFHVMDDSTAAAVHRVLQILQSKITKTPPGIFRERVMMGKFKNVKAILIESPYVMMLREQSLKMLEAERVRPAASENFAFTPHVSNPLFQWAPTTVVPFRPWLNFAWKGHELTSYELTH